MKIALLSCGRSDYSIYYPLLKKMQEDPVFDVHVIAFGTHVSVFHGETVQQFEKDGFHVSHKIESLVLGDSSEAISTAIGLTDIKFAGLWASEKFDLIIVLGDRYEMFSATSASVPFNIPIVHLHGGETTLGAIDNVFRHCITLMSSVHFASTEQHAARVREILGYDKHVYNVGALSLDNVRNMELMSSEIFREKFGLNLSIPTVLATFHPETVQPEKNEEYAHTLMQVFAALDQYQIVLTMPNADTMGNFVRGVFQQYLPSLKHVKTFETLGMKGYFTCMQHAEFVLGNSSSGIIEAASFGKYVINLGDRQKGRSAGDNVLHCVFDRQAILEVAAGIPSRPRLTTENVYGDGQTAARIVAILKELYAG